MNISACRRIADCIAPELSDCYILQSDRFTAPSDAAAFGVRGPHLDFKDHLQKTGEWRGWTSGFICFIRPPTIPNLIHEMAHLLPRKQIELPGSVEPTADERKAQQLQLNIWADSVIPYHRPWTGHDLQFIRAALHLFHRAETMLGERLPLWDLCIGGGAYGLSDAERYQEKLGCEVIEHQRKSFAEIEKLDPPQPFIDLYASDVRYWHSRLAEMEIEKYENRNK